MKRVEKNCPTETAEQRQDKYGLFFIAQEWGKIVDNSSRKI